jgi:hypothetical protein
MEYPAPRHSSHRFYPGERQDIEYIIVCDAPGAEALLHAARYHCPDAVKNIELATRTALHHQRRQQRADAIPADGV